VSGATIVWTAPEDAGGSFSEYVAKSDGQGSYEVPDPDVWADAVTLLHPDFAVRSAGREGRRWPSPLGHEMEAGKAIVGRVAGAGPSAGPVSLWLDGWPVGKTNADGTFLVPHGPPAMGVLIAKAGLLVGLVKTGAGPLTIDLRKGRSVTGTVRDARTRAPIAGAVLTLMGDADGWPVTALSDDRGRYEFVLLLPGRYVATAARLGYTTEHNEYDDEEKLIDVRRAESRTRDFMLTRQSRLTGRVLDEKRRPVEGARIVLLPKGVPTLYVRGDAFAGRASEARTSADGSYSLAYDAPGFRASPPLDGPLLALKEGYAAARIEPAERGGAQQLLEITLVRGVALEGRVVAEDGRSVPDVSVLIAEDAVVPGAALPAHAMLRGFPGEGWVKTGPDGRFAARVRPGPHDLSFRKPGYAAVLVTAHDPRPGEPLEVVVGPALALRGAVVSADGAGVPGVTLYVRQPSGAMTSAVTGEDGGFSLDDLSPGAYELYGMKEGTGINVMRQGELPSPDLRIELPRLGVLRGRVVDAKSGAAVTTFQVMATPAATSEGHGGAGPVSVSDVAGEFLLKDVPVGEISVKVHAEGYLAKETPALVSPDGADAFPFAIALEGGATVHGRVTTGTGEPLADVTISADDTDGDDDTVESDESGNYRFAGLRPGKVTLRFDRTGYVSAKKSVDTAETTRMDAVLSKGLTLKGVVVSGGVGVARALVHATSSAADAQDAGATSSEGGSFTLEGLTPGRYTITAASADDGDAKLENVEAETAGLVRLVLERKPTAVLTGAIAGLAPGDSSSMVRVVAIGEDGQRGQAPVDARGAFRMEKAPVGRVRVQAFAASLAGDSRSSRPNDLTLRAGSESQTVLEFRDDVVITGRVTRDGSPAANGTVFFRAVDGTGGMAYSRLGTPGDYEVVGLEPGPYTVTVTGMGFSYSTDYLVRESAQFDIDATGVAVRGQTVDAADGSPLAGVDVSFWWESETTSSHSQTTNGKGEFVARGLREGRYRVLTSKKGYGQQVRELDLEPGGSADVTLELVATEGLTLTVVDARDARPLEATVVVRDLAKRVIANQHSGVEADGSLNVPIAPGRYLLSTSAAGYGTATVPVTVPGRGLRVGLTPGGTLVLDSEQDLRGRIRLVKPDGEEYVRCWCNGIADIQLTGRHTKIVNVTPGTYAIQLVDHAGAARTGPTVIIEEGGVATLTLE
jgi:hypothetical protein